MKVCFRGNFRPQFSSESHEAWSLEDLGCQVVRVQEDEVSWQETERRSQGCDLLVWVQTYGFACNWDRRDAFTALANIGQRMPTIGLHLDRWWGLEREWQPTRAANEPFFHGLQHLFTADGDNDDRWAAEGVNHHWSPPAVFGRECYPGTPRPQFVNDVIFVGSWREYAHPAWWPQRKAVLDFLRARYQYGFTPWPKGPAVRGENLNDLYASARVVVGDSALASTSHRYFSDRAFETVGRGGFYISPYISGLADMLVDGEHCRYYTPGDMGELAALIDHYLAHEPERQQIVEKGQAHVRANHTYKHRLAAILDVLDLV